MTDKEKVRSGKPKRLRTKPHLAPGMDQLLESDANKAKKGDDQVTSVTRLLLDATRPILRY